MDIAAGDDVVSIMPINENFLEEVTMLYNSSDMRYATGFAGEVPVEQLALMLSQHRSHENEFISSIFMKSTCDIPRFIGIVSGVLQGNELWIKLLAILPSFRHEGFGARAICLILKYFAQRYDVISAFVCVVEENKEGLRFWTSQGFSGTGSLNKALFGENQKYRLVIMNKRL